MLLLKESDSWQAVGISTLTSSIRPDLMVVSADTV